MQTHSLEGGFREPAIDAAHAFRAIMEVMARPGLIETVTGAQPPAPLSTAAGVCLLTLCDHETPVYLAAGYDQPQVREWIAFHTGAPICDAFSCHFAVGSWESIQPLDRYPVGTSEYPDRSATLLVELPELSNSGATLTGPGIKESICLSLPDMQPLQANPLLANPFLANHRRYPLGVDFLFTQNDRLAALPRSTEVHPCT
ncbi:MAG: phosphonate C-P lyase system protein PhnH [Granulosicoccus sp.]|nr:phosphonate C-P lyase system protein PhnH [Granulosicoccus sp.]